MRTFKKSLSVFLCFVMLFTTFCFFPLTGASVEADAATITNEGRKTAFYVPEVIYLYPSVSSWTERTSSPFQYFVENTVDVNNIYNAPVPSSSTANKGTIYFAAEEGMNAVNLRYSFVSTSGTTLTGGEVSVSAANARDGYFTFEISGGKSPELEANENGYYIEWILEYTTAAGELKASHAVTYVYKPYVVPYGAVARVANKQGDVNVDNQNITWVTGVHSIDVTVATKNQLFARYQTVAESASGSLAFSPFLSKDRYGYVGPNRFQGEAPVEKGGYYAVFTNGTSLQNSYFWAGQSGTSINNRADSWFVKGQLSNGDKAYTIGTFDYMNNEDFSTKHAISQVTPTRLGTINIDTSRYSNLNEIPNLAVGFMITSNSAIKGGNTQAKADGNWLIGDATGKAHKETGDYTTADDMSYALLAGNSGVDASSVFASETVDAYPIANGIKYAGAWNKELSDEATEKYTVKSVVRIDDKEATERKYAVTSSAVGLNAVQIDKTALREAVAAASENLGVLGMKRNKMSLYYAASGSEWNAFLNSYMNAYKVLTRLDATASEVTEATNALNAALEVLLNGKSLKVLFDVNYDGIRPNLLAPSAEYSSTSLTLSYNKNTGEYTLNGTITEDSYPFDTDMSISEGEYTVSIEKTAGEYLKNPMNVGTVVLELFHETGQFPEALRPKKDVYEDVTYVNYTYSLNESIADRIRSFKLWVWRNGNVSGDFRVTNLTYKLKLEKGGDATAYSPEAKIISGESYGELPVPTRDGFSFGGWYADKECTIPVTADDAVTARILYADWIPNVYSVSFDNIFSLNEFAKYPSSLTVNKDNASAEYADGRLTVIANGTDNGDVYTTSYGSGENHYNVSVLPSTEYVFEYDVDLKTGSQVHLFLYDTDNGNATLIPENRSYTVYDADGNILSQGVYADGKNEFMHCYSKQSGHVVLRFRTPAATDKLSFRFGTTESTTTTAVYSNIRLIDAKTYDLIKWNSAEMFYDYGESYSELATATRDGYVFEGWYTRKNGSGTKVTTNYSVASSNITLYSNWTANTYNVTLLPNNAGYGNTIKIDGCVYDREFTLPDVTSLEHNYSRVGYTFIGWATTPDAAVAEYANNATVKNLTPDVNGEVTLYAVWSPNVFNVQFDANGGQGTMANVQVAYDSNVPLPECTFENAGYTFAGWALSNQGSPITEAEYDVLKDRTNENVKLFALWRENIYKVTFDKNSNDAEGSSITNSYSYTTAFTLPGVIFSRKGYILSGWTTTPDGAKLYDVNQEVSRLSANADEEVVLYAVWTPIKYKISFNANGGQGSMDNVNATYDKDFVLPDCSFTKAGYHFVGWSTSVSDTNPIAAGTAVQNLASIQDSTVTLWAVWEINTYTVTLKYKNAQGADTQTAVSVKHGESVSLPADFVAYPIAGTKKHYVFDKWSIAITNVQSSFTTEASYSVTDCSLTTTETPATCTKEGSVVTKCRLCAYESVEVRPVIPHKYGDGVITTPVTCLADGVKTFTCSVCSGEKTEAIEASGHSLTFVPAKDAACNAPGNVAHMYCSLCKKGYDPETATATTPYEDAINYVLTKEHTPGAEPTCTTAQVCTVCGSELNDALGHSFRIEYRSDNHVDCSTTMGDYEIIKTCTVCDAVETEYVYNSYLPHDYVVTTVPPTCTDVGYDLYDCSRCPASYTENEVLPLGHNDEDQDWFKVSDPTCTVPGENVKYCTVCGEVSQRQEIEATGHAPEAECTWYVTKEATCTEPGVNSLICPKCNTAVKTEPINKDHDFKWTVTLQPGCETMGKETDKCTVCGASRGSRDLPMLGHDTEGEATCDKDLVCKTCHEVVEEKLGHDWDNGSVVKEPTETEEGLREFICLNDPTHTKHEVIPVRIVIELPAIPEGGSYLLSADINGYIGNIHTLIKVEEGIDYTVRVDNTNILTINDAGHMMAVKDGNAVITIITNDGKFQKQLPVTVRTYRTITFDINGEPTEIKAYVGDSFTPPTVDSYTDENGYEARFKQWLLNGTVLKEFICTGDMYLVAQFTASCDYDKLDELTAVFYNLISGNSNNALLLNIYKQEIETAKAMIEEFSLDRSIRDSEEQGRVDAAAKHLSVTIAKIYPEDGAWIEIRGNTDCTAGTYADITAYLMPINVELADGVWESSDTTTGFFTNGKFYAVKQGTVTLTVSRGSLSASVKITVNSTVGARVLFFDTLLTNANYILESGYVIRETTNLFWAPDVDVKFRVITDGTYEEYNVYVNNKKVTPDIRGTYTIPANTGDAHVRIEGLMSDITDDSADSTPTMSIWEAIVNFFKRIGDFFRNLFGM